MKVLILFFLLVQTWAEDGRKDLRTLTSMNKVSPVRKSSSTKKKLFKQENNQNIIEEQIKAIREREGKNKRNL